MATLDELGQALVNADKAGDTEAATKLAGAIRGMQAQPQSISDRIAADPISQGARNFTQDPGNYGPFQIPAVAANSMAGFFKGARDLGMGLEQMTSFSPQRVDELRAKVAQQRQVDAPLEATGAGRAGELGFNVASILPTMAIPGVNTARGAALLGGAFGAAQPSTSTQETAINTGIGGALGGAGQAVANKLVSAATPIVKSVRDQILSKAQELGFVVSPAEGRSGIINKLMTGAGNKQQTAQEAAIRNAATVEKIAKNDLGVAASEQLTPDTFSTIRQQAYDSGYKPVEALKTINWDPQYVQQIKALGKGESQGTVTRAGQGKIDDLISELDHPQWTGKGIVDDIRTLREEGNANIGKIKSIGEQQLGRAQLKASNLLEDLAERNLQLNKAAPDTIQNFRDARATIAKAHTIEDAMGATSSINPAKFAKNEADAKKLSPEMYAAWKFAKEFPKSNQDVSKVGGMPWNVLMSSGILGGVGYGAGGAMGHKEGALLGLLPLIRGPARSLSLSRLYQSAMVNPESQLRGTLSALARPPAQGLQRIAPQAGILLNQERQ